MLRTRVLLRLCVECSSCGAQSCDPLDGAVGFIRDDLLRRCVRSIFVWPCGVCFADGDCGAVASYHRIHRRLRDARVWQILEQLLPQLLCVCCPDVSAQGYHSEAAFRGRARLLSLRSWAAGVRMRAAAKHCDSLQNACSAACGLCAVYACSDQCLSAFLYNCGDACDYVCRYFASSGPVLLVAARAQTAWLPCPCLMPCGSFPVVI
ncbi:hypothetical protein TRVL_06302 [Trypanosoma vivax]|nr:hypothetical protein TRVL_06302 [Trypanosoma vivax]